MLVFNATKRVYGSQQQQQHQRCQPIQQFASKLVGKTLCEKLKTPPNLLKSVTNATRLQLDRLLISSGGRSGKEAVKERARSPTTTSSLVNRRDGKLSGNASLRLSPGRCGSQRDRNARGGCEQVRLLVSKSLRRSLSLSGSHTVGPQQQRQPSQLRHRRARFALSGGRQRCSPNEQSARLLGTFGQARVAGTVQALLLIATIFCTLGVELAAPVRGASLARVQPIWLSDGLLAVDQVAQAAPLELLDNQAAASIAEEDELAQQEEIRRQQQLAAEREKRTQQLESILSGALEANAGQLPVQPADELVSLQRRRLDRNRALEPPAWIRERPIRRDGLLQEAADDDEQPKSGGHDEVHQQRLPRADGQTGEVGAHLADELYAELLRYLLEGALGVGSALDSAEQNSGSDEQRVPAGSQQTPMEVNLPVAGVDTPSADDVALFPAATGDERPGRLAALRHVELFPANNQQPPQLEYSPVGPDLQPDDESGDGVLAQKPVAQAAGQSFAAPEDQFHVFEEIDQVDGAQINAQQQQQPQPSGGTSWRRPEHLQHIVEQSGEFDENGHDDGETLVSSRVRRYNGNSPLPPPPLMWPDAQQEQRFVARPKQRPAARQPGQLMEVAAQLIRLGRFERVQLLVLGRRLKAHLEQSLGLAPNSIVGLYPIEPNKLLVELDPLKLDQLERAYLIEHYNYLGGRLLAASWRKSSRDNPVPLLAAILDTLNEPLEGEEAPHSGDGDVDGQIALVQQRLVGSVPDLELAIELLARQRQGEKQDRLVPSRFEQVDRLLVATGGSGSISWPLEPPLGALLGPPLVGQPVPFASARVANKSSAAREELPPTRLYTAQTLSVLIGLVCSVLVVALFLTRRSESRLLEQLAASSAGEPRRRLRRSSDLAAGGRGQRRTWRDFWLRKRSEASDSDEIGEQDLESNASRKQQTLSGRSEGCAEKRPLGAAAAIALDGTRQGGQKSANRLSKRLGALVGISRNDSTSCCDSGAETTSTGGGQAKADGDTDEADDEERATSARFRSSRSYIKSLVEALTKAARLHTYSHLDDEEQNDEDADEPLIGKRQKQLAALPDDQQQVRKDASSDDSDDILVSQMDISAAHLILDYMEKHLEDKQRLVREWRELNCDARPNSDKATRLILQRLAKVASADENRDKNRNQAALPFDRNRVRLGVAAAANLAVAPPVSSTGSAKKRKRGDAAKSAPLNLPPGADYINASFIFDDDQRKPTHIISQAPTERTCAQFWQMVWEQEVSVIVMLTRLNEDGAPMCHCYWPTGCVGAPATECGHAEPSRRRSSVTSVLSANALPGANQPPIVTNSNSDDNVLCFDVYLGGAPCGRSTSSSSGSSFDEGELDGTPRKQKISRPASAAATRFEVQLISEHVSSNDYLVRNLYLINRNSGETRTISQFHYLAWAENRVPENVHSFLQFRRKVHKSYRNLKSPILVHCSDGTGRAGTYTLIDIILERIKNGAKEIDPRATLEHLREQRVGLCATQSQFEFVLVALAEEIQIILNALPQ